MKVVKLIFCMLLSLCILGIQPAVVQASSADKLKNQDAETKAQNFMKDLLDENYESCMSKVNPELKKVLGEDKLKSYLSGIGANLSQYKAEFVSIRYEDPSDGYNNVILVYKMNIKSDPLVDININYNKDGFIDNIHLSSDVPESNYQIPTYAKQDSFYEKNVMLGEGTWKLPAVLSMPKGNGPFPAVVLVHGSGASDKDESIGNIKVFKDLAEGLASNGIAVLRYEKRSKQYSLMDASDINYSIKKETIDDAVDGVKLLKNAENIDKNRVFVIGHSQGAMLAPSIVKYCGNYKPAGAIMMAAPVDFFETFLDQSKYLNSMGYMENSELDQIKSFCNIVSDKSFPGNVTTGSSLMSGPPGYWLSMKNSTHVEDAQNINVPLLIMQGEKDYQVDISNLEHWKSILKDKNNVEYNSYPKLNHLFIEGKGLIGPEQYDVTENVPDYIIKDICNWIQKIH